jgi:hypothetical protein
MGSHYEHLAGISAALNGRREIFRQALELCPELRKDGDRLLVVSI